MAPEATSRRDTSDPMPPDAPENQLHGGFDWDVTGLLAVCLATCGVLTTVFHICRATFQHRRKQTARHQSSMPTQ